MERRLNGLWMWKLHSSERAGPGIFRREVRAQLSALLENGQANFVLPDGQLVYPVHGCQRVDARVE